MEARPKPEESVENTRWSDPPPVNLAEDEFDSVAFELWQRACREDVTGAEDCSDEEEAVASHASCL